MRNLATSRTVVARGGPRLLLILAILALVVIGIYVVLTPDFGDTAGKILLTSLCVTGQSSWRSSASPPGSAGC